MFLRCTQKLLAELRLSKSAVRPCEDHPDPLDEWYGHVFILYPRRKCAVFMHARTKFCFFAYDRNRNQLNDIKGIFRKGLGRALYDEHYPGPVIRLFNERLEDIRIGLAQDRRVLGFINQRVQDLKCMVDYDPQDRRILDERIAGLAMRRNPMVKEKPAYAIDQMRDFLLNCPELKGVAIHPSDHKHEELDRFYQDLWAQRKGPEDCRAFFKGRFSDGQPPPSR